MRIFAIALVLVFSIACQDDPITQKTPDNTPVTDSTVIDDDNADQIIDTDSDGIADADDNDDDNDGVPDTEDAFPLDANEDTDTDGDGVGNNADPDDDGDNVDDADDAFPLDANESVDSDGDGIGDNADTDDDNDGILDDDDVAPLDASVPFEITIAPDVSVLENGFSINTLTWSSAPGAEQYTLYSAEGASDATYGAVATTATLQATDTSFDYQAITYYKVEACNPINCAMSTPVSAASPIHTLVFPAGYIPRGDPIVSPDGSMMAVIGQVDSDWQQNRLFTMPTSSNTGVLAAIVSNDHNLDHIAFSPDSQNVLYVDRTYQFAMYSIPAQGGAVARLNPGSANDFGDLYNFSNDGTRVIFTSDIDNSSNLELYSNLIAGGDLQKLSPGGPDPRVLNDADDNIIAVDSDDNVYFSATTGQNDRNEYLYHLYKTPVDGGTITRLSHGDVTRTTVSNFTLNPYSDDVVYLSQIRDGTVHYNKLYLTDTLGSSYRDLAPTVTSRNIINYEYRLSESMFSPDGKYLVASTLQTNFNGRHVVHSYELEDDFTVTRLHGSLQLNGSSSVYAITPDSSMVVFGAKLSGEANFGLHYGPINANASTRISPYEGSSYLYTLDDGYTILHYKSSLQQLYSIDLQNETPANVVRFDSTGLLVSSNLILSDESIYSWAGEVYLVFDDYDSGGPTYAPYSIELSSGKLIELDTTNPTQFFSPANFSTSTGRIFVHFSNQDTIAYMNVR